MYITTQEFKRQKIFEARLKQANLATKVEIVDCIKKVDVDDKLKN